MSSRSKSNVLAMFDTPQSIACILPSASWVKVALSPQLGLVRSVQGMLMVCQSAVTLICLLKWPPSPLRSPPYFCVCVSAVIRLTKMVLLKVSVVVTLPLRRNLMPW